MDGSSVIPQWFQQAIDHVPKSHWLSVLEKTIHYQTWHSDRMQSKRALLFVHGHAAHTHWWDFIAPQFSQQFKVAALDLSGNGDSEHRDKYLASQFATEIAAVASQLGEDTIVIAHSFGGSMARIAAHLHPGSFSGLILVDSVISNHRRETIVPTEIPAAKIRHYPTVEEAARRFRLRPPQPKPADYLISHIAKHSVRATDLGVQFKLDPQIFAKMWPEEMPLPDGASMLRGLKIPCAYVYGAQSRFCPPEALVLLKQLFVPSELVEVTNAHHHLFLDQPTQFVEKLRVLLDTFA